VRTPEVGDRVRSLRSGGLGTVVEGQCVPIDFWADLVPVHWDGCERPGFSSTRHIEVISPLEQLASAADDEGA